MLQPLLPAAAVLKDQLWLLGNFRAPHEEPPANLPARSPSSVATLWTFDFEAAVWAHVPQQGAPPLRNQAMLAPWVDTSGQGHLLLFGGSCSALPSNCQLSKLTLKCSSTCCCLGRDMLGSWLDAHGLDNLLLL